MRIRHSTYIRNFATIVLGLTLLLIAGAWYTAEPTTPVHAQSATITFVGQRNNKTNAATSLVVNKPTGVVQNNLLIASAVTDTTTNDVICPPSVTSCGSSEWIQLSKTTQGALVLYTWYKVAGGSEPASYRFTTLFTKKFAVGIVAYRGTDTTNPVNVFGALGTAVTTRIIPAPQINTSKPNTLLVQTYAQLHTQSVTFGSYQPTPPTMNERFDVTTTSGSRLSFAMSDQVFSSMGTTPSPRLVWSSRTGSVTNPISSISHLLALRPPNQPPTAGVSPTSIDLPYPTSDSATLTATSVDVDGSIVSWSWIKTNGPAGDNDTITSPNIEDTGVSWAYPPVTGTYTYRLTVTDNESVTGSGTVTVTIPTNLPPFVDAGTDIELTTPSQTTRTLLGSASDEQGGPPAPTVEWTKRPGSPAGGEISSPTSPVTDVTGLITTSPGTYTYRLTATDNLGLTASDEMTITVPQSYPPIVSAGPDPASIELPDQNTVTLNGTVQSNGAPIESVQWTEGQFATDNPPNPAGDTIVYPIGPTTDITFTQGGTYNYLLTATDANGKFATDTVRVIVTMAGNALPVVDAGADQAIDLPGQTSVTLSGSATDANGPLPLTYTWSKVSGPVGGTIQSPNSQTTEITGLSNAGTYVFRLTAKDGWGGTGTDDVAITAGVPAFSTVAPVSGVIWASSIGWISLGGASGGNVQVDTSNGAFSGFAWASNIGYINFAPTGTAPNGKNCSTTPCAVLDIGAPTKNKVVSGWIRACSVLTTSATNCSGSTMKTDALRGGWDGWIKLYDADPIQPPGWTNPPIWTSLMTSDTSLWGTPYDPFGFNGVFYDDLLGFAWGGIVVGWIDFFGASVLMPVPILNVVELQQDFGDVWVGTTKDMDFTVENIGDLGSFLRGIATVLDTTYFTCVNNCDYSVAGIPVGTPRLVTIRFTSPMTAATGLTTQVNFTGTNTTPPSSLLRTVLGNAIIPVFGNGLSFGNVVVGRYRELTLTFSNAGSVDLGMDTVVMPFPEYTCIPSCVADLSPGFVNNITIRFTPTAVQTYNGDAYLENNPTVTFPFTGAGVLGAFQFKDQ